MLRELDEAVACAQGHGGEPGPAFIDFPTDVLRTSIADSIIDPRHFRPHEGVVISASSEKIRNAALLLAQARRSLVISGRGARGAEKSLPKFLDAFRCAYLDTPESRGLIPQDHPRFVPAMRGRAMREADLVFTLGRSPDF